MTRWKFHDRVFAEPYSPYYDDYVGQEFVIDHWLEEDEQNQHVMLTCITNPAIMVKGYVELSNLVNLGK